MVQPVTVDRTELGWVDSDSLGLPMGGALKHRFLEYHNYRKAGKHAHHLQGGRIDKCRSQALLKAYGEP